MTIACLFCRERIGCKRGVCVRCYSRLKAQVRRGLVTWLEAEEMGVILPSRGGPGKPAASVKQWFGDYRRAK